MTQHIGLDPKELSSLRELVKDLQAGGWEVVSTALHGEDQTPVAVVCRKGGEDAPLRTFVLACRSLLRAAEKIVQVNPSLSAEEHETLQAARLTIRVLAERALVSGATLGTFAHSEMARAVQVREDLKDENQRTCLTEIFPDSLCREQAEERLREVGRPFMQSINSQAERVELSQAASKVLQEMYLEGKAVFLAVAKAEGREEKVNLTFWKENAR